MTTAAQPMPKVQPLVLAGLREVADMTRHATERRVRGELEEVLTIASNKLTYVSSVLNNIDGDGMASIRSELRAVIRSLDDVRSK